MTTMPEPIGLALKILVVDDDEALLRILRLMLTREGHAVAVASNGAEGMRAAGAAVFDLVITDLVMPEKEGIQLVRELRAMAVPPRVIAISGGSRGANTYLELAAHLGADATLQKPFTQHELTATIACVMQPVVPGGGK